MYWDTLGALRLALKPAMFPVMISGEYRVPSPKMADGRAKGDKQLGVVFKSL